MTRKLSMRVYFLSFLGLDLMALRITPFGGLIIEGYSLLDPFTTI